MPKFRKIQNSIISYDKQYCTTAGTGFNRNRNSTSDKFYEDYRKIWNEKNICIVTCKNMVDTVKYNIFDNAKTIDYVFVPPVNAYDEYNYIYSSIKKYNTSYLIILMCGPTAKVLAYELTKDGYRALDLGHLMKAYDYYKRQIPLTSETINTFYGPDL